MNWNNFRELLDRIRTAVCRLTIRDAQVFKAGDLIVDVNHKVVQVAHAVHLTVMEYALLELLVFNAGRLLTQHRLAHEIWGEENGDTALQMLRTTISSLRQKLDVKAGQTGHIATEPGVGYRLRIAPSN